MGFGQMELCGRRVVMKKNEKEVTKATCFQRKLSGIFVLDVNLSWRY